MTSNKWPVALHGVELAELARRHAVPFRAESAVMSGTPVLSTLITGLAGAVPIGVRGLLNATANAILTRMAEGVSYPDALAEAQAAGLAERDPAADVDGAGHRRQLMVLSALVFGRQLSADQVECRGISGVTRADIERATAAGARIKHVAALEFAEPDGGGEVTARVRPELVELDDPLATVDGTTNAIRVRADPVGYVTITGPGAGPQLAGQGVLSDLLAVARRGRTCSKAMRSHDPGAWVRSHGSRLTVLTPALGQVGRNLGGDLDRPYGQGRLRSGRPVEVDLAGGRRLQFVDREPVVGPGVGSCRASHGSTAHPSPARTIDRIVSLPGERKTIRGRAPASARARSIHCWSQVGWQPTIGLPSSSFSVPARRQSRPVGPPAGRDRRPA